MKSSSSNHWPVRVVAVVIAGIVGINLYACEPWPPHYKEMSSHVNARKFEIGRLVEVFRSSEFGRITCDLCWAEDVDPIERVSSYKFVDEKWQEVENPNGALFAKMMRDAGMTGIFKRSSGAIHLELAVELRFAVRPDTSDRQYVTQVFYDSNRRNGDWKECVAEFENSECGWCKVTIDDNFWIRYGWWPSDPLPSKTLAAQSGDISWDELSQFREAALSTCEQDGLSELGYSAGE